MADDGGREEGVGEAINVPPEALGQVDPPILTEGRIECPRPSIDGVEEAAESAIENAPFVAKNVTGDFNIRRLPASDDAQIIKVFGRDFSQGRVLRASRVVAVIIPIVGCAPGVEDTAEEPRRRQGVVEMCHNLVFIGVG